MALTKELHLKRDYVVVDPAGSKDAVASFGGNQGWFDDGAKKAFAIKNSGCGLIGASDIIIYLESALSQGKMYNVEEYKTRVRELEKHFLSKKLFKTS